MHPKADWPPLRPEGGMLNISRDGLITLAVEPFVHRARREELTARLFMWMDEISVLGVPLDIWIDGSYVTTKSEPEDVDICVLVSNENLKKLDDLTYTRFEQLVTRAYVRVGYHLDLHLVDATNAREQEEWREFFGKGHDRTTVKGIFAMKAGK